MFVIVKLSESESKGRRKRRGADFICERTDIDLHRYFFTVTVKAQKGSFDKKSLYRYVGRLRNSVIMPDSLPAECKRLSLRRLLNAAPDFLKGRKPVRHLCICDCEGYGADLAEKLLPFAPFVHIVCGNKECYTGTVQKLFNKYGATVTLSQKWNNTAESSELVITPALTEITRSYKGEIFTCDTARPHPAAVYTASGIVLPYHIERLRPTGTDKLLFATYLYEKCSINEIEGCPYENIDISRR